MAGTEQVKGRGATQGTLGPSPAEHVATGQILHQRGKMTRSPIRMALGGFAIVASIGYIVLYSNKKPQASAMDVAKVTAGVSHPDNTHPRK